ncbi:cytochrome C [Methylococcus capsulatus]|uniref:cytochrome C n=1 Tax=Methylococcus capsulatus TaxID=414 RepID=UPI00211B66E3|nr:cytochrome C [Methylococcus capsulatus]
MSEARRMWIHRLQICPWLWAVCFIAGILPSYGGEAPADNGFDRAVLHPAIPLLDESGRHVLDSGLPYSPKTSCGNGSGSGCHDYARITRGYHFEQGRDETRDGFGNKLGLPQLTGPGYFGGYNCMSGNAPGWLARKSNGSAAEFGDFGAPDLVRYCGACHSGGGWGEFDRNGGRYDEQSAETVKAFDGDYFSRQFQEPGKTGQYGGSGPSEVVAWDWRKSGVREADCMLCHADFSRLKTFPPSGLGTGGSESAALQFARLRDEKFIAGGFFRHAASAIWEFLDVRPDTEGGAALLAVERTPATGTATPDYRLVLDDQGNPKLHWNRDAFDESGKIQVPMLRFPASDNCMYCHKTGNSRRGFYGFGPEVRVRMAGDGTTITDFRTDVHKGAVWTEDNGQVRVIDNCNACHARQYYKSPAANVDLDADHNFPKGNGDNDVRNDLDNAPPPASCEHCHDQAAKPALPSGHKNVLEAHREIWKANGDMRGYPENTLDRITQTHLNVVACQTCHISRLADNGKEFPMRYRYRVGYGGRLKIFPYKPAYRYFVQDRNSGRVLNRYERFSVIEERTGSDGGKYGAILDPASGKELGRVVMNGDEFGEPPTFADYKALKQAYDALLGMKGYAMPNVRFVFIESNEYALSHATRPSPQAVQCEDCHARKQSGAFSALISAEGLLGEANVAEVAKLPDRRLVDAGIVELGMPYYKVQDDGRIVENVADVLYASRLDPSMSILRSETARTVENEFKTLSRAEALAFADLDEAAGQKLAADLPSGEALLFGSKVGHSSLRGFALIQTRGTRTLAYGDVLKGRVESRPAKAKDRTRIFGQGFGNLVADIYSLAVMDASGKTLPGLVEGTALVRLPYRGKAKARGGVNVLVSNDGKVWQRVGGKNLLVFRPRGDVDGYVVVRIRRSALYLTLADKVG